MGWSIHRTWASHVSLSTCIKHSLYFIAMPKKLSCLQCEQPMKAADRRTCYACKEIGCNTCTKMSCGDCGVIMCKECSGDGRPTCGCYGRCTSCGSRVDRGSNGWPCGTCKKWLCNDCPNNKVCKECNPEDWFTSWRLAMYFYRVTRSVY